MYESSKRRINWIRLFLIVIIIFLIILLTIKCISMIKGSSNSGKYYEKQLESLNEVALDYYNKDNIPDKVGKSSRISLSDFDEEKIEFELSAKSGDTCDLNDSYIQVTRLETEYQVKSYIKCDNYDDYINTYVSLEESTKETTNKKKTTTELTTKKNKTTSTTKKTTTTKVSETTTSVPTTKKTTKTTVKATTKATTKPVTTTKKVTTTVKVNTTQATVKAATDNEVTIGFNSNGGNQISSITIKKGSTTNLPVPARTGYTFTGWYKNGVKYTSKTTFNDSVILVAEWSKN